MTNRVVSSPVVAAVAISLDGRIKDDGKRHRRWWISEEDKQLFGHFVGEFRVIVMGRKTYQSMGRLPLPGQKWVVYTRNPENYRASRLDDLIVFTAEAPVELVSKLRLHDPATTILVVGGSTIYEQFIASGAIDYLYVTVEPVLLGVGKCFADSVGARSRLQLMSSRQLNGQGSLFLEYAISA